MLTSIGQSDSKQPLVHVFGRAVPRPMGAVNFPARSNGDEGGAGAGVTRAPSQCDRVG